VSKEYPVEFLLSSLLQRKYHLDCWYVVFITYSVNMLHQAKDTVKKVMQVKGILFTVDTELKLVSLCINLLNGGILPHVFNVLLQLHVLVLATNEPKCHLLRVRCFVPSTH
jgi:hypothetical protein